MPAAAAPPIAALALYVDVVGHGRRRSRSAAAAAELSENALPAPTLPCS